MKDSYLKSLMEIILDEERLVTYISVSKELCIHVNDAKLLLSQVITAIKQKNSTSKLNINYIISGLMKDNHARTSVCTDLDLEKLRASFKIIFFEHIYSISLGQPKLDPVAFVNINKFEDISLCAGLIKGNTCLKHTSGEISNLKTKSQIVVNEPETHKPHKESKPQIKEAGAKNGDVKNVIKLHESQSEPNIKAEPPSPRKNLSYNKSSDKKNVTKAPKSITGFFSKANSAPSSKITKSFNENPKQKEKIIEPKKEVKVEKMNVDENIPENNVKIVIGGKTKESKFKRTTNQIKKNAKIDKKRKRVLHVSDSESENEGNDPFADEMPVNHESDDEIPPTPNANTVKITSGVLNPKKRRKIVDKTYTDDDGYILTKKEEVYESCSEHEDEVQAIENLEKVENKIQIKTEVSPKEKEKKGKNSKKKVSPPQKGKQATMMNFFKKV